MFSTEVSAILPRVITWRRYMHQYPELSFEEKETTAFLIKELKKYPNLLLDTPTRTGVIATLKGSQPGPCLAVRAEIDALPIDEKVSLPYASVHPGIMHACGHDGHAAVLLGLVSLLAPMQSRLRGEIRFIFQHAEEVPPGGAAEMRAAGVGKNVDAFYSFHLSSAFETGTFGVRSGAVTSATDRFNITVRGKGGHSAFPETCVDPVVLAAQIILSLQTIVSRRVRAIEPAVLSVCKLEGGTAYNIIPGEVKLTGSTRTFSEETRNAVSKEIEQIVKGICDTAGASYDYSFEKGYASVINDKKLADEGRSILEEVFGKQAVFDLDPLMPGEDFSAFLQDAPGFYVELGARNAAKGCDIPHHNCLYQMDEDALGYGLEYMYQLLLRKLF